MLARIGELPLEQLLQLHAFVAMRCADLLSSPLEIATSLQVRGGRAPALCCFLEPARAPARAWVWPRCRRRPPHPPAPLQEALQDERAEVTQGEGLRLTPLGLKVTAVQAKLLQVRQCRVRSRAGRHGKRGCARPGP